VGFTQVGEGKKKSGGDGKRALKDSNVIQIESSLTRESKEWDRGKGDQAAGRERNGSTLKAKRLNKKKNEEEQCP